MKIKKRKLFRIIWFSFVVIFSIWQWSNFQSRDLPEDTFVSTADVDVVTTDNYYAFNAVGNQKSLEVIFFQGGLTDPKAYAPLCRKISEAGYDCFLIRMDYRLPQYDYQKIAKMFDLKAGSYVIGGHSQGAKIAAQFVYENPGLMKGLFLMGTSHPRDINLSSRTIPTIKLYAEYDGLASVLEVLENEGKLPQGSELVLVSGGNHSQFGYLGNLLGDDAATISLQDQQEIVFSNVVRMLNHIEEGTSEN